MRIDADAVEAGHAAFQRIGRIRAVAAGAVAGDEFERRRGAGEIDGADAVGLGIGEIDVLAVG